MPDEVFNDNLKNETLDQKTNHLALNCTNKGGPL